MIVDSSAIIAILYRESDRDLFAGAIERFPVRRISAATFVEAAAVVDRRQSAIGSRLLDHFLREANIVVEPVTEQQARIAREAYRDFGKGSGHIAKLNFGDCFAYALAKAMNEPLLFKGDDFKHTDVKRALP